MDWPIFFVVKVMVNFFLTAIYVADHFHEVINMHARRIATNFFFKSGANIDLINPDFDDVNLSDIASGLSKMCLYNGQCNSFYSVAQRSCLLSDLVEPCCKWDALMSHAHFAILGDLDLRINSAPLVEPKSKLSDARAKVMIALSDAFRFSPSGYPIGSLYALEGAERRDLFDHFGKLQYVMSASIKEIKPWTPLEAERNFIERCVCLRPDNVGVSQ